MSSAAAAAALLSDAVVYITGGSTGIGEKLVRLALARGALRVHGISRRGLAEADSRYVDHQLDLGDMDKTSAFRFESLPTQAKKVVLILNAGLLSPLSQYGAMPTADLKTNLMVNAVAPQILVNNFLHSYGGGSAQYTRTVSSDPTGHHVERVVINISSGAATSAYDTWGLYCSAKASTEMMVKALHTEIDLFSDKLTRAYSIAPGVVDTDMQAYIREKSSPDFSSQSRFVELHEQGKLYKPEPVAAQVLDVISSPDSFPNKIFRVQL